MRFHVALVVFGSACVLVSEVASANDELIARITAALEARQERAKSYLVEWSELQSRTPDREGEIVSDRTVRYRISGHGEKLRQTRSGLHAPQYTHPEFIRVFDGAVRRELFFGGSMRPGGFVNDSGVVLEGLCYHHVPVTMSFRPLDKPRGGIELMEWQVVDGDEVDGVPCCVLKHQVGPGVSESLWLSNDDDFYTVR